MSKKIKRLLIAVLAIVAITCTFLASCTNDEEAVQSGETDAIQEIYSTYVVNARENNEEVLTYEKWYASIKGEKGDDGATGNGITSVEKTSTDGLVDTYTVTFTDGTTTTFTVTNGKQGEKGDDGATGNGITSVEKTSTDGLVDTYTVTFTDGTTTMFTITNGKQGEKGDDGQTPVITIGENGNWYIDGVDTQVYAGSKNSVVKKYTPSENANKFIALTENLQTKSLSMNLVNNMDYTLNGGIQAKANFESADANITYYNDKIYVRNWAIYTVDGDEANCEYDIYEEALKEFYEKYQEYFSDALKILGINTKSINYEDLIMPAIQYVNRIVIRLADSADCLTVEDNKYSIDFYKMEEKLYKDIIALRQTITYRTNLYDLLNNSLVRQWIEPIIYDISPVAINENLPKILYLLKDEDLLLPSFLRYTLKLCATKPEENEAVYDYVLRIMSSEYYESIVKDEYSLSNVFFETFIYEKDLDNLLEKVFFQEDGLVVGDSRVRNIELVYTVNENSITKIDVSALIDDVSDSNSYRNYYYNRYYNVGNIETNIESYSFNTILDFNMEVNLYDTNLKVFSDICVEHIYGVKYTEPTCTECGYKVKTCLFCGDVVKEKNSNIINHKYEEIIVEPTCSSDGYTEYRCKYCGDSFKTDYIEATGEHDYSLEWTYDDNNTHRYHKCKYCNAKKDISSALNNLEFVLNKNGTGYIVKGIGSYAGNEIVIDSTYNGMPVTEIANGAFSNCSNITSIYISEGIKTIGSNVFYGCDNIKTLYLPSTLNCMPRLVFNNAHIERVIIDSDVSIYVDFSNVDIVEYNGTSVNSRFGYNIKQLVLGNNVTRIESYAFEWCKIDSIVIPNSVTYIGNYAFYYCSLTSIVIPNSVTYIGSYAFYGCYSLEKISLPLTNNYSFNELFGYNVPSSLKEVIITGGESIGSSAFRDYNNIESIVIADSVKYIGDSAFYNCYSLKNVTIGNSVTSIGDCAFCSCSSLTSIEIPDSVISIGSCAFYNCSKLAKVTIGKNVSFIASSVFNCCNSLTSVTFEDTTTWYYTGSYDYWQNKTGGSYIDVSNSYRNAWNLCTCSWNSYYDSYSGCYRNGYCNYYWYKI